MPTRAPRMDLGADDFLLKPFAISELLRCVAARLKRAALSRQIDDRVLAELRLSLQPTLPHKLFTPLAGILGLTQLLEEGLDTLRPVEIPPGPARYSRRRPPAASATCGN